MTAVERALSFAEGLADRLDRLGARVQNIVIVHADDVKEEVEALADQLHRLRVEAALLVDSLRGERQA